MTNFDKYSIYKSRGERRIASFLESQNIAFQYEYPLAVEDRDQIRVWYPDFRLPEYGIIIEYFGMNGDRAYDERTAHKISTYEEARIDGIYLRESSFSGNWQEQILERIEESLEEKLQKVHAAKNYDKAAA